MPCSLVSPSTKHYLGIVKLMRIDIVTNKTNQTSSFLQRNLSSCLKDIKESSYKTFVRLSNNVVVVCRKHYINTLKQELNGTMAYEETSTDEKSVVNSHSNDLPYKFTINVEECQDKLPTMYWLPKLHKRPYKARFIANNSKTLAFARLQNFQNYLLLASLPSKLKL